MSRFSRKTNKTTGKCLLSVGVLAAGLGLSTPDGYIAAIAAARGFSVATRDVAPFRAAGIKVVDPWEAKP